MTGRITNSYKCNIVCGRRRYGGGRDSPCDLSLLIYSKSKLGRNTSTSDLTQATFALDSPAEDFRRRKCDATIPQMSPTYYRHTSCNAYEASVFS